jgi:hypothetical protein
MFNYFKQGTNPEESGDVVDYELLKSENLKGLNDMVKARIKEKWQPYGDPLMAIGQGSIYFGQAVVKYARKYASY